MNHAGHIATAPTWAGFAAFVLTMLFLYSRASGAATWGYFLSTICEPIAMSMRTHDQPSR